MTKKQILLVQQSWKIFRAISPEFLGDVFYSKLFVELPLVKKLFVHSMVPQYQKLIDMLSLIVGRLDQLEILTEDIRQMAKRHVTYGVKRSHYKAVGEALLWTLEQGLGVDWSEELKEAWSLCYGAIAGQMMEASNY